jgi:hypothetical protein
MSQPTGYPGGGVRLGKSILILSGIGSPNASTASGDAQLAGVGSLYTQSDAAGLWLCTAGPSYAAGGVLTTPSAWSQITIP